ncbi:hypothetical protein [Methylobacterium sp. WL120]|uniref:hypothetical protein n=1 Tax=Methylobacterium sp. WL120 TaxID=2603887 RepID=UPI00164EDAD8|nr:hypothetical protein [Methylobacterium sp. WL120]
MARTTASKPAEAVTPAAGLRRTKVPAGDVGKSARLFSAAVFSEMLAVSRNTVTKWIRDGMPHEGDEKAYRIDVGKAVRWLQEKAATEAKEEAGGVCPSTSPRPTAARTSTWPAPAGPGPTPTRPRRPPP